MTIRYGNSTLGQPIVIYESPDEFTTIRQIFLFETLFAGALIIFLSIQNFSRLNNPKNSSSARIKLVYILFLLTTLFHTAHYADHNYRSVYYHEPKWVHQQYFISPMEFPFYTNILTSIIGVFAMKSYFRIDKSVVKINR